MSDPGGYVVILFGSREEGWCTLSRCPLGSARWFRTREEADTYAASVPAAFEPHTLLVEDDPSGSPADGCRSRGTVTALTTSTEPP